MDIPTQFGQLSVKPEHGTSKYKKWIEQDDFVCFLQTIPRNTEVILYGSAYYAYIYGVLIPTRLVTPPDNEDLDDWSCNPLDSWSITINYKKGRKVSLSSSLETERSKPLARGEQIVFARRFDGRHEKQSYIELSQKLTHALGLHWVPERDAFCRFDGHGDVEDVARFVGELGLGGVVSILRATLDEYLVATDQVLLLLYDSTRFEPKEFPGWLNHSPEYQ
jgi:hypothetical protein